MINALLLMLLLTLIAVSMNTLASFIFDKGHRIIYIDNLLPSSNNNRNGINNVSSYGSFYGIVKSKSICHSQYVSKSLRKAFLVNTLYCSYKQSDTIPLTN